MSVLRGPKWPIRVVFGTFDAIALRLLAEQQAKREELRMVSGMLPICPSCRKIRDDEGFWHRVEDYVEDHADVSFTHGICPGCGRTLYPDLVQDDDL